MHKPAQHRIDTCGQCNGTGRINGPKIVHLTPDDAATHNRLQKARGRVLTLALLPALAILVLAYIPPGPSQQKAIILVSLLPLLGGPMYWSHRLTRKIRLLLVKYGVDKHDWYLIKQDK